MLSATGLMASQENVPDEQPPRVFDPAQLFQNTMENQNLAMEVLGLFMGQLPGMLEAVRQAHDARTWHLATHALKGSAGLAGATALQSIAAEIGNAGFPEDPSDRGARVQVLTAAAVEFRDAVRRLYPEGP